MFKPLVQSCIALALLLAACAPTPVHSLPGAVAARELQRFSVTDANGRHVGHAEGLYVAGETGRSEFAVVRVVPRYYNYGNVARAGFGIKHVPIPWHLFELDASERSLHLIDCEDLIAGAPTVGNLTVETAWVDIVADYWRTCAGP